MSLPLSSSKRGGPFNERRLQNVKLFYECVVYKVSKHQFQPFAWKGWIIWLAAEILRRMDCVYPDLTTALGDRAIHKNTENIKADAIAWLEVTRRGAHNCFRIIERNVYLHNIRCSIECEYLHIYFSNFKTQCSWISCIYIFDAW